MKEIDDQSINMILCDLPYGTTACRWDNIIPFEPLWEQYKRLIKPTGAIVLFGSQPFSSLLITSNLQWFKYEWVWKKSVAGNFVNAKNAPLKKHENILVFSPGTIANRSLRRMTYNPQGLIEVNKEWKRPKLYESDGHDGGYLRKSRQTERIIQYTNYPNTILDFPLGNNKTVHPTQKSTELCEYLIKTYTNPGDLVLDNCIGSGTTAIAAMNTGRNFIGMELDVNYYEIAKNRVENHKITLENNKILQNTTEKTI
jgi:site-specific DNA-methyltransferase (adenine-specific)